MSATTAPSGTALRSRRSGGCPAIPRDVVLTMSRDRARAGPRSSQAIASSTGGPPLLATELLTPSPSSRGADEVGVSKDRPARTGDAPAPDVVRTFEKIGRAHV